MIQPNDNGIYYFLGNITSHIIHALPLYEKLGGTFVVLSDKAKLEVESYNVPVINIDDQPYKWTRFGYKIKPVYHYAKIGRKLRKTVDFLNSNAKVVLFYDLYDFDVSVRLTQPKTVFLTHGNMLKSYMNESNRLEIVKQYDYMAALGPYLNKQFVSDGIDPDKLVDLGIARTDQVVADAGQVVISDDMIRGLGINPKKKIISYMPTFWGASSVYNTGKEIVRNFPDEYTLLFRPHPQTPQRIIDEYLKIIKDKPDNVVYLPEGYHKNIGLPDVLRASSAIIGDVSSVMLEAILTRKPLVFVYGEGENKQSETDYTAIEEVVKSSQYININNVDNIRQIINSSLHKGVDEDIWKDTIDNTFYHPDGTSAEHITEYINSL